MRSYRRRAAVIGVVATALVGGVGGLSAVTGVAAEPVEDRPLSPAVTGKNWRAATQDAQPNRAATALEEQPGERLTAQQRLARVRHSRLEAPAAAPSDPSFVPAPVDK
jgi:hypothetical protein